MVMIIGSVQQTIGVEGTIQEGGQTLMVDGRGCFFMTEWMFLRE